jgi:hypothetical protein
MNGATHLSIWSLGRNKRPLASVTGSGTPLTTLDDKRDKNKLIEPLTVKVFMLPELSTTKATLPPNGRFVSKLQTLYQSVTLEPPLSLVTEMGPVPFHPEGT